MTILRVEFIGFTVSGPRGGTRANFKPQEWPGWTARAEGQAVLFEGEGKRVEVPRNLCYITWALDPTAARYPDGKFPASRLHEIPATAVFKDPDAPKRRGRPPKSPPTEPQAA